MEEMIDEMLKNGHWSLLNYGSESRNQQSEFQDEVYLESDEETDKQVSQPILKELIAVDETEMIDNSTSSGQDKELLSRSMSTDECRRVSIVIDSGTISENILKEYRIRKNVKMMRKVTKNSTTVGESDDSNIALKPSAVMNHLEKSHQGRDILFTHRTTRLKYRVLYEQKCIGREKMKQILEMNSVRTQRGDLLCKIHSDCRYHKPKPMKEHLFNTCSGIHLRRYLFKYSCAYCSYTCSYQAMLLPHFEKQHQMQINSNIATKKEEFTVKKHKSPVMDHQKEYRLNLTDENIYTHRRSGYKYQIFYKGQAISQKTLNRVFAEKSPKTESGWLICPLHNDCSYTANRARSRTSLKSKGGTNDRSKQHIMSLLLTYLCRYCFRVFDKKDGIFKHLLIHSRRQN